MLNDSLDARFKIGEFRWKSSNFSQTVEMKIEINNLSVSDFGSYSCVINTTAGVSSELVFLKVQNEERGNVLYVTYLFIYSFIYLHFIYLFIHNFYVLMYFGLTFLPIDKFVKKKIKKKENCIKSFMKFWSTWLFKVNKTFNEFEMFRGGFIGGHLANSFFFFYRSITHYDILCVRFFLH